MPKGEHHKSTFTTLSIYTVYNWFLQKSQINDFSDGDNLTITVRYTAEP